MIVRIRFGRGPVVSRRKGKNAKLALLAGSLLTLVAICLAFMGSWRLFGDVDLAGDFLYPEGFLSHWQVWLGAAGVTQYIALRLTQYSRGIPVPEGTTEPESPAGFRPSQTR